MYAEIKHCERNLVAKDKLVKIIYTFHAVIMRQGKNGKFTLGMAHGLYLDKLVFVSKEMSKTKSSFDHVVIST